MTVTTPLDVFIGKRIRKARKQRGISLHDIAPIIPISYQQVQKYESGVTRIPASSLYLIARSLGLPTSYFYPIDEVYSDNFNKRRKGLLKENRQ